jgi:hypothetical protein
MRILLLSKDLLDSFSQPQTSIAMALMTTECLEHGLQRRVSISKRLLGSKLKRLVNPSKNKSPDSLWVEKNALDELTWLPDERPLAPI